MRDLKIFIVCCGLSFFLSIVFGWLACRFGILFEGLDFIFAVIFATGICVMGTIIFLTFKPKRYFRTWLVGEASVLALIGLVFWSWLSTNEHMNHFLGSKAKEVRVHNGRSIMFSSYVHFSGPPEVISAVIQSRGLAFVSAEILDALPEGSDISAYNELQRSKVPWDWWHPITMKGAKFLFLHHKSDAVQGWSESWWVNGSTNEVYALISG